MPLTNAQRTIVARVLEFQRLSPEQKVNLALSAYQRRWSRVPYISPPEKLRVRVTYTRSSGRPFFVVQVRQRYIAAYTLAKLIEKIALGYRWNRVDLPCGVASGALNRRWK